jgi:hypothetical protein
MGTIRKSIPRFSIFMHMTIPVSGDYTNSSTIQQPTCTPLLSYNNQKNGSKFIIHNMRLITMNRNNTAGGK